MAQEQFTPPPEKWSPVVGWEEVYEISSHGRLKRVGKNKGATVGALVKPSTGSHGYHFVTLAHHERRFYTSIHRLVCTAFHGLPPSPKHEVNHKDGVKANNGSRNLEWCTHAENGLHAFRTGLRKAHTRTEEERKQHSLSQRQRHKDRPESFCHGETHYAAKLSEGNVKQILCDLKDGVKGSTLARQYGVCHATIVGIQKGTKWKHIPRS